MITRLIPLKICAGICSTVSIRKKVEVLDDGDSIKFTLIPGSDNTSIETLHIPEKFEVPA